MAMDLFKTAQGKPREETAARNPAKARGKTALEGGTEVLVGLHSLLVYICMQVQPKFLDADS